MGFFINVDGLVEFEKHDEWENAVNFLYDLWQEDKNNADKLCRLIAECWIILSEHEHSLVLEETTYIKLKKILISSVEYGSSCFENNASFLWLCGYMINTFPFLFYFDSCSYDNKNYFEFENKGRDYLSKAAQLEPSNCLYKVTYLGTVNRNNNYLQEKQQLQDKVKTLFSGDSMIEEYFTEIFGTIRQ